MTRPTPVRGPGGKFVPSSVSGVAVRPTEAPTPSVLENAPAVLPAEAPLSPAPAPSATPEVQAPQGAPQGGSAVGKLDPLSSSVLEGVGKAHGGSRPTLDSAAPSSASSTDSPQAVLPPSGSLKRLGLMAGGLLLGGVCLLMAGRMRGQTPQSLGTLDVSPTSSTPFSSLPQVGAAPAGPQLQRFG